MKMYLVATLIFLLGLYGGEWFPDIDQKFDFLTHRSVFTHGLLLPFLLFWLVAGKRPLLPRLFVMGFCLGVAVHLGFDLFPRAWQGFALIHMPFFGWIFPAISWVWIAGSMVLCIYFGFRLVRSVFQGVGVLAAQVGLFAYVGMSESQIVGPAIAVLGATVVGSSVALWRSVDNDD